MKNSILPKDSKELGKELERLRSLKPAQLTEHWRALYGADPPARLRRSLMIQALAYRLQEKVFGGLKPATRHLLEHKDFAERLWLGDPYKPAPDSDPIFDQIEIAGRIAAQCQTRHNSLRSQIVRRGIGEDIGQPHRVKESASAALAASVAYPFPQADRTRRHPAS